MHTHITKTVAKKLQNSKKKVSGKDWPQKNVSQIINCFIVSTNYYKKY